eukprot:CAMPEP_0182462902 /NCGR_PEP_ID=MMETSP1319-20130603/7010_1 /TAXON_ID=172717 /ORGANISM="Bolidomonas pacifica, Strain RCC208" /LENGTH=129 /DNA_ID=CAMNT_0024662381 /DNA_START=154 /DNA_END=543 /DNA_ORIENTATION=-
MKSVAAILIPTSAPLLVANTKAQPLLCLTATALAFLLMRMTINTSSQAATCKISFGKNKAKEKKAIENVTITSMSNRIVRVSMGSCHLLGALAYSLRNFDDHPALLSWALVAGQCVVSGIWLSSGKNGQ